jgi:hypothetical protein
MYYCGYGTRRLSLLFSAPTVRVRNSPHPATRACFASGPARTRVRAFAGVRLTLSQSGPRAQREIARFSHSNHDSGSRSSAFRETNAVARVAPSALAPVFSNLLTALIVEQR